MFQSLTKRLFNNKQDLEWQLSHQEPVRVVLEMNPNPEKPTHAKTLGLCQGCQYRVRIMRSGLCGKHRNYGTGEVCIGSHLAPERIVSQYDY